ncbi:MAG TPA: SMC family ATPase, partial [Candidatus Nanoarchaeia archaeon]|nr:SMC family ATPase [Candidatus Nanoarchaeia archaeon]
MLLKSLALKNIRSYTDHSMEFPSGSVLLAGDIGAGKSSILYAVEFALFGIKRGELSGQMLLRHGKNEGHAELALEVEGKEVIIKRTLKRIRDEVKQDSGYIIIGGRKKEGSPTELRAEVLSLLGYPKELLNRPNDLLYRFTVYTPQEEMKAILTEDKDARLDTLRKVFNIDKYKNIASNSSIIAKDLRDKRKLIEARIS